MEKATTIGPLIMISRRNFLMSAVAAATVAAIAPSALLADPLANVKALQDVMLPEEMFVSWDSAFSEEDWADENHEWSMPIPVGGTMDRNGIQTKCAFLQSHKFAKRGQPSTIKWRYFERDTEDAIGLDSGWADSEYEARSKFFEMVQEID